MFFFVQFTRDTLDFLRFHFDENKDSILSEKPTMKTIANIWVELVTNINRDRRDSAIVPINRLFCLSSLL